ncbi:MAG TPA: ABC transporter permease [Vicinamibacterales bacterium]|jgi:predicted permease|nr:ABC transporter permease [Vicinamibacterales bacterium]
MADLTRDLRYAWRLIRKAPVLSIATIVTLALGIGLNAGVFTVLSGLLLRPRVTVDPGRFVHLQPTYTRGTQLDSLNIAFPAFSTNDFLAIRDRATTLRAVAAWGVGSARVSDGATSDLTLLVSCEFFATYGLDHFERGRGFRADECGRPGTPVAVISDELWRTRFDGAADILDKPLVLNGQPFAIVGVTPRDFAGQLRGRGIWLPYTIEPAFTRGPSLLDDPSKAWLVVEGRLKPAMTSAAAASEIAVLMRQQDSLVPGRATAVAFTNGAFIHDPAVRPVAMFVLPLVLVSVGMVLLIACANVTLLLLSRAIARQREIAIRLAIGCGRARLVRMLLTESVLFAALGMPLSIWLAWRAPAAMRAMFPQMPYYPMDPDVSVLSYLAAASLAAGIAAGLAPALETLRQRLTPMLAGQDPLARSGGRSRLRDVLIAAQVGMSLVLVAGTVLFFRVERAIASRDPSIDSAHVMLVPYEPPRGASAALMPAISTRVLRLPGVRSIAYVQGSGDYARPPMLVVRGRDVESGRRVPISVVSASYFATIKQPMLLGQGFGQANPAASIQPLVISDALARLWWPSGDAVGALVDADDRRAFEVVGVVHADAVFAAGSADTIQAYTLPPREPRDGQLFVRFDGDAKALQTEVHDVLRAVSPATAAEPITLAAADARVASNFFVMVKMVGTLGLSAIVLALVGIYGVVSFAVGRRTREIGIRMSLGASRSDIVRLVLRSGAPPIAMGIGAGLVLVVPAAIALTRVFQYTPVPLRAGDPLPYLLVAASLAVVAAATMLVPARRASAVTPSAALRTE